MYLSLNSKTPPLSNWASWIQLIWDAISIFTKYFICWSLALTLPGPSLPALDKGSKICSVVVTDSRTLAIQENRNSWQLFLGSPALWRSRSVSTYITNHKCQKRIPRSQKCTGCIVIISLGWGDTIVCLHGGKWGQMHGNIGLENHAL